MTATVEEIEKQVRSEHRHIKIRGGYVACTCRGDWTDHNVHVAEEIAAALAAAGLPTTDAEEATEG